MMTIQMVKAKDLMPKLNSCLDKEPWESKQKLMERKANECSPKFVKHIQKHGVIAPVVVMVDSYPSGRKRWSLGNGHHRFATALVLDIEIPVLFVDDNDAWDYMHCDVSASQDYPAYYGVAGRIF